MDAGIADRSAAVRHVSEAVPDVDGLVVTTGMLLVHQKRWPLKWMAPTGVPREVEARGCGQWMELAGV